MRRRAATRTCRRSPGTTAIARPGLGFGIGARARRRSTPDAIGGEAAERAVACSAPPSPLREPARSSSTRPSPPASSASSAACSAPTPCSAAARPSPAGSATRSPPRPSTLTDDGLDPDGPRLGPVRRRGNAPRPHPADRGGQARHLPARLLHRPPRGQRPDSTGNAARSGYRSPPGVSTSNLVIAEGARASRSCSPRPPTASTSPTSPASTPASTRSPGRSRSAPRAGDRGRRAEPSPLSEFTIASDLASMLTAVRAAGAARAGSRSAARSRPPRC